MFVALSAAAVAWDFAEWEAHHGVRYDTVEEREQRRAIFTSQLHKYPAGTRPNVFAATTPAEFAAKFRGGVSAPPRMARRRSVGSLAWAALPPSIDWRTYPGVVPPVGNFGVDCNPTAFVSAEVIGMALAAAASAGGKNGNYTALSSQALMDCSRVCGVYRWFGKACDTECNSFAPNSFSYAISAGLPSQDAYPSAMAGPCRPVPPAPSTHAHATWTASLYPPYDEWSVAHGVVASGPVAALVDASGWQFYTGGVIGFNSTVCPAPNGTATPTLDHPVSVVGYSRTAAQPYWVVRNSWGVGWGEEGYVRLELADTCGITAFAAGLNTDAEKVRRDPRVTRA